MTDHGNAIFLTRRHLVPEGRTAQAQTIGSATDNASKWSARAMKVSAAPVIDDLDGARNWLLITVDDDGPGLPAEKRGDAVKRWPSAWMNPNPVQALACRL